MSAFLRNVLDNCDCIVLLQYTTTLTEGQRHHVVLCHDRLQRNLAAIHQLSSVNEAKKVLLEAADPFEFAGRDQLVVIYFIIYYRN